MDSLPFRQAISGPKGIQRVPHVPAAFRTYSQLALISHLAFWDGHFGTGILGQFAVSPLHPVREMPETGLHGVE